MRLVAILFLRACDGQPTTSHRPLAVVPPMCLLPLRTSQVLGSDLLPSDRVVLDFAGARLFVS
jgi:hypothetical protein